MACGVNPSGDAGNQGSKFAFCKTTHSVGVLIQVTIYLNPILRGWLQAFFGKVSSSSHMTPIGSLPTVILESVVVPRHL